jgi:hypothetical protein
MLADPTDQLGFSAAAQTLLTDREQMRVMGAQACQTATALGWPKVVEKTEAVFQKILLENVSPLSSAWLVQAA